MCVSIGKGDTVPGIYIERMASDEWTFLANRLMSCSCAFLTVSVQIELLPFMAMYGCVVIITLPLLVADVKPIEVCWSVYSLIMCMYSVVW